MDSLPAKCLECGLETVSGDVPFPTRFPETQSAGRAGQCECNPSAMSNARANAYRVNRGAPAALGEPAHGADRLEGGTQGMQRVLQRERVRLEEGVCTMSLPPRERMITSSA